METLRPPTRRRAPTRASSATRSAKTQAPKHVTLWLEADDKDKLTAFLASKDLAAKNKAAGVKGKPKQTIVETGEMKMYQ